MVALQGKSSYTFNKPIYTYIKKCFAYDKNAGNQSIKKSVLLKIL